MNTQEPMLCKRVDTYDAYMRNPRYGFQWKWDGNGMYAHINEANIILEVARSHTTKDVNGFKFADKFALVTAELTALPPGTYQGELVAYRRDTGKEEIFTVNITKANMAQYNFVLRLHDVLQVKDKDYRQHPYRLRLAMLHILVNTALHLTGVQRYISAAGIAINYDDKQRLLQMVEIAKGEGITIKDMEAPYTPGKHLPCLKWKPSYSPFARKKLKLEHDCIVIGLTKTKGEKKQPPNPFGALILAQYMPNPTGAKWAGCPPKLRFMCKCAGISDEDRAILYKLITAASMGTDKKWFEHYNHMKVPISSSEILCMLLKPNLVVEIKCMNTTKDGHYRSPNFIRIRDDKLAKECFIEEV